MLLSRDREFYGRAFRLTGWIASQNAVVYLVGLAGNVMVGAYSQDALAGIALAGQFQYLLHLLVTGIGDGMAVLTSQYWGGKKPESIRSLLSIGLKVALTLGMSFLITAQFFASDILGLLTRDGKAVAEGAAYLRVLSIGFPFFCISIALMSAQRSVENVAPGMVASGLALICNVTLSWLLIFGNLGFPELGIRGAAVAVLAGRMVECAAMVVYTYGIDKKLALGWKQLISVNRRLFRDFCKVVLPVALAGGSWGAAMIVQTGILGHLSSPVVAADSIANALFQVVSVVVYGIASASAVLIGKAVGAGERNRLKEYVDTLQVLYLVLGMVSGLILFLLKDWLLMLYAITPEAKSYAGSFITILSFTIIGTSYQCGCLTGIVRGGGNTKFVLYNDLIFMWCIVIPLSFLTAFVLRWNPVWVYVCLKSDQITKCAVALWQVNTYHWVRKVTREDGA